MPNFKCWLLFFLFSANENFAFNYRIQRSESWTGRWFPYEPTTPTPDLVKDKNGRIPMGIPNRKCDDAKTNLTLDWDNLFEDYICSNPRSRLAPNESVDSIIEFENIPKAYMAPHFCMDQEIIYSQTLPSFGPHRPLWPVYGEYKFLPKQRWLHSLEHGGIVALYHPCADLRQISLLKKLVKSCLRRHVITPSRDLTEERPLGLLAWGVRYTMSRIYPNAVRQFIKERALKGPEKLAEDGQYDYFLKEQASTVSDFDDKPTGKEECNQKEQNEVSGSSEPPKKRRKWQTEGCGNMTTHACQECSKPVCRICTKKMIINCKNSRRNKISGRSSVKMALLPI